uniref:Anoctamin n=2 Tax=Mesocestoides corti TaxID=53468 RepID=A0A5K3FTQ7_MESCO
MERRVALYNVNKTDDPGYAEAQQRIGTEMGRLPVFIGRYIGPVIKLILLASIVVDTGYLLYEYRVKTHVIPFLSSRFTTHRVNGSPRDCENGSWWFHPSGSGHQPWQHILQEEIAFPIAYTIMAFERPDQVWRLLRAIYRPHNFYCVHFDQKSPLLYKKWLRQKIETCIPSQVSNNIVFIPSISVYHSYMSVLEADLACMRALWQLPRKNVTSEPPWKYLI